MLVVRTICEPKRLQSIQNVVEDENSAVDLIAVYNKDINAEPSMILPKDTIFAIKEPFYKTAANGGYLIRVDHPSDIIRLDPSHDMIPSELRPKLTELDQDVADYKADGNAAFKNKEYRQAVEAYSKGISECTEETDISFKRDLHRNRAIVNTYLHRFEQAYTDGIEALIPDCNGEEVKLNVKALYRAGRALYGLGDYAKAKDIFERLLALAPDDKDGLEQISQTTARIQESETGDYDFTAMSNSVTKSHKQLNHASFTNKTDIRSSQSKGRGLFATTAIKAGELVLVEKAFSVVFASELGNETHVILNLNNNTGRIGAHAILFNHLVQKMRYNPGIAQRVPEFFDGGYIPKCTASLIDGVTVIDTFQVAAIMDHNCFACPSVRTSDTLDKAGNTKEDDGKSVGVWVKASHFNHACDANARRAFMGDMMIVRATKDIAKDEEISISYRALDDDHTKGQAELEKLWKFKCDCRVCKAENQTSAAQRKARLALLRDMKAFLENHRNPTRYTADKAALAKAESIYNKLDATFDKTLFASIPRVALAHLGEWICAAYQSEPNMHKVIDTANRVLRDLGYGVQVKGKTMRIDRTHCYAETLDIDAAMYAAHACYYYGKAGLGKQYKEFAKEGCMTAESELRGFEKRYKDSETMA